MASWPLRQAHGALERALRRLVRRRSEAAGLGQAASGAAFRAAVDQRLRSLERQLDEVKGRVNGLLFMVAGTALVEVVRGLLR